MKTVILSGGEGRRMRGYLPEVPKPLVEIGGEPILMHIMKHFAHYGHSEFILCLGWKGETIVEYFVNRFGSRGTYEEDADYVKHLRFEEGGLPWHISFAYTGEFTPTGGRISKVRNLVPDSDFFVTYADGVSNVDLDQLLEIHLYQGKTATLTAFSPQLQYGALDLNEKGEVTAFKEKPQLDMWINGGFFVFKNRIFELLMDEHVLEQDTFAELANARQLFAFKHHGFWKSMDTYKDYMDLEELWSSGEAKWKVWT